MAEKNTNDEVNVKNRLSFINLDMIPSKLGFFFIDACTGSISPFLNLLYVSSGLTAAKAGLSNGIGSCFTLVASPLWGVLADSTNYRTLLFVILCLGASLTQFCQPWVVKYVSKIETNITCFQNTNNASSFIEVVNNTCKSTRHLLNPDELFYAIVVIGILLAIFFSGVLTYTEGTIIKAVYTRKTETSYGMQKLFSPIGFAVGNFLAGVAIDHYNFKDLSHFTAAFYVYLPFSLLLIPMLYMITCQTKEHHQKKEKNNKVNFTSHLILIFKNLDNIMFLFSVIVSGLCFNMYIGFFFLFLDDEMHPSKTMMSVTVVIAMASELIIYPFSSKIIKLFRGPIPCVILGIFSYLPRLMLISYCTNMWCIFPLQLFHGIGMSLSWSAQVEHNYHMFPKESTTAALGVIASLHFVGASIATNMVGGVLYEKYGGRILLRGVAIMSGIWSFIMILYFGIKHIRAKHNRRCYPIEMRTSHDIDLEEGTGN